MADEDHLAGGHLRLDRGWRDGPGVSQQLEGVELAAGLEHDRGHEGVAAPRLGPSQHLAVAALGQAEHVERLLDLSCVAGQGLGLLDLALQAGDEVAVCGTT